jgi:hypothetical protein
LHFRVPECIQLVTADECYFLERSMQDGRKATHLVCTSVLFGKTQSNVLISVLSDIYDVNTIVEAKSLLLEDISRLPTAKDLPHIPKRRDGPNGLARDVDDIISVLTFLDEQKLFSALPRYVSDSPDSTPSLRLFDWICICC